VERRAEAQAREDVGHRHLLGGLPLRLREDDALDGQSLATELLVEACAQAGHPRPELAQTLDERHDERPGHRFREAWKLAPFFFEGCQVSIGGDAARARLDDAVGHPPQTLEESELEGARPGPELAQGQRAYRLIGGEEPRHPVRLEARVAGAAQLLGHPPDPRSSVVGAWGETRGPG